MREKIRLGYAFLKRYFYALIVVPYLFTFGLRSGRNRNLINTIGHEFGYDSTPCELPEISLDDVTAPDASLLLLQLAPKDGNVSPLELIVLANIVRSRRAKQIFEFGTFDGRTTLNLAVNSEGGALIYTLDLPKSAIDDTKLSIQPGDRAFIDKDESGARFAKTPYAAKIQQLYGDSATFDFAPFRKCIDAAFVDASHSYEYVLQDSLTALQLIRPEGGVILWHDYGRWDGVTRALNQLRRTSSAFNGLVRIEGTTLAYLAVERSATASS